MTMQVAHKVWIGNLMNGNKIFNGDKFVSVEVINMNISRVNLIANVIDVYSNDEKKYITVTLDDGSGQIRIKGFSDNSFILNDVNVGETVCIIGWLRYFNNEVYVIPDVVRHVDTRWALIRRLELIKIYGEPKNASDAPVKEDGVQVSVEKVQDPRQMILSIIKKEDEGIDIDKLIMDTHYPVEQINSILNQLIEAGEIYEPRPGRLRSMT